ncbi:MAG: hypothetical protein ACREN2_06555 [Candidatus Dormibacteria bacterium]
MLVLFALALLIAAMAGGYFIRIATATSATPTTVVTSTDHGGSSGAVSQPDCTWVQNHKGC